MKKKQIIAAVSGSALASGMAHGAILYSGPIEFNFPCGTNDFSSQTFDINNDGLGDFLIGFDGLGNPPNSQKPYIQGFPTDSPGSSVLVGTNQNNLPVTLFGTLINSNYLGQTDNSSGQGYFDQENDDGNANYVGSWPSSTFTEGYVGIELWDGTGNTNFGWVRMIYDGTTAVPSLTVVDYAYETTPMLGIIAGATNDSGMPTIYDVPPSQTNSIGAVVQFGVTALADPSPSYQWQMGPTNGQGPWVALSDGGVISGSTNATLEIDGATAGNEADYRVVITNSLGAVTSSPPATLVVVPPVATPTPQILFAGTTAFFNVDVSPSLSPAFQWQKDGANLSDGGNIAGSTSSRLQVANLQDSDAGTYDVVVTVNSGPSTSTSDTLTVLPASLESAYDAAVLAAHPAVYYRLSESGNPATNNVIAYDNAGGFNGIYGIDVTNGFDGVSGPNPNDGYPGFSLSNAGASITTNDVNAWVTLAPWNLNSDSVTFTAWVKPSAVPVSQAKVLFTGTSVGAGIDYYYTDTTDPDGNLDEQLGYAWDEGNYGGTNNDESEFYQSGLYTPTNAWSFLAVAVTSSNATLYVFNTSGTNSAVDESYLPNPSFDPLGSTNQVMPFNMPEYVGSGPGAYGAAPGSDNFAGTIADVAVFTQTLSSNELQTLYDAALGVVVSPPVINLGITNVGPNVQITWSAGSLLQSTNVSGPWTTNTTATSPYIVAPSGTMFYKVVSP